MGGRDEPQIVAQSGYLATPDICAATGLHRTTQLGYQAKKARSPLRARSEACRGKRLEARQI